MATAISPGKPGLVRASGLLFVMLMGSNVFNYAFHALASRTLGPSDYGVLVSMLALLSLMAVPSQTIQTVVAKWTAVEELAARYDRIAALAVRVLKRMLLLGGLCWLGLAVISPWLAKFFRLSSTGPIIAVGLTTVVMLIVPIVRGLLQGLQRFNALGANLLADGIFRFGSGILIFWLGYRVSGSVIASALGGTFAFVLALIALPEVRQAAIQKTEKLELFELKLYSVSVLVNFGAYMVLSTLDVIMVKHYFEPEIAGYYAAASMVGKAFLFLPFAIAHVLFPKVSASQERKESTRALFFKSLALTAGILGGSILLVWFSAPLIITTLFGRQFLLPQTLWLVKFFGMAVTPLALVYILLQYNLALHNRRFVILLLLDVPVLLLLLIVFHARLETVLGLVGLNHVLIFVGGYFITPRSRA